MTKVHPSRSTAGADIELRRVSACCCAISASMGSFPLDDAKTKRHGANSLNGFFSEVFSAPALSDVLWFAIRATRRIDEPSTASVPLLKLGNDRFRVLEISFMISGTRIPSTQIVLNRFTGGFV